MAACVAVLLIPSRVSAQDSGFYLGGALGQANFTEWCSTAGAPPGFVLVSCDDKDSAWKIFGGYRFNRYLALEATYVDWGKVTGNVQFMGPRDVSAEQTSMGIAAVGSLGLGPQFSVFGKAGFLVTEQETRLVTATSSSRDEAEETEFHYGLGARFQFTPNWAARAEWERTEKLEVEMFSLGVEFKF